MNRCLSSSAVVLLVASLWGCAAPRMNLSEPAETAFAPAEDRALVYFLRPRKVGYAIHAAVYDGEEFVGFVPYQQKLPYLTAPGEHLFMVVSEAADFLKADLEPGRTYYVQVVPRMGMWRARFSLAPVTAQDLETEDVQEWIREARTIRNNAAAYEWAEANHGSVLHKKGTYLEKWYAKPEGARPYLGPDDGRP